MKNKTKKIIASLGASAMGVGAITTPIITTTSCSDGSFSLTLTDWDAIYNWNENLNDNERNVIEFNGNSSSDEINNTFRTQIQTTNIVNGFFYQIKGLIDELLKKFDRKDFESASVSIKNMKYNNGELSFSNVQCIIELSDSLSAILGADAIQYEFTTSENLTFLNFQYQQLHFRTKSGDENITFISNIDLVEKTIKPIETWSTSDMRFSIDKEDIKDTAKDRITL